MFGPLALRSVAFAAVLGIVAAPATALAAGDTVQLQVVSIRATKTNSDISPQLKPLVDALKKTFKYTGYKLLGSETRKAAFNKGVPIALAGNYRARITPIEKKDNRIKLKVEVFERKGKEQVSKLSTTISLAAGKNQLFGGWKLDGDDVLIIAVSAKYLPGARTSSKLKVKS